MKIKADINIETKTFVYLTIILVLIIIIFTQIDWKKAIFEVTVYNGSCPKTQSPWENMQWKSITTIVNNTNEFELPDFSKCKQITCNCAKNTDFPCMAMCLEC